ncbi:hypothetical protein EVAR_41523_1 [Eumeta japonica]|uniref:Uncharacterized protein n=1 Tax=Eumeta variegata TaxID=151549 RepID=A0A4C1X3Z0_EUMVA|nr:hypothetical protein EVAR_41523_1 [Eumeta japonica]
MAARIRYGALKWNDRVGSATFQRLRENVDLQLFTLALNNINVLQLSTNNATAISIPPRKPALRISFTASLSKGSCGVGAKRCPFPCSGVFNAARALQVAVGVQLRQMHQFRCHLSPMEHPSAHMSYIYYNRGGMAMHFAYFTYERRMRSVQRFAVVPFRPPRF